jgi:hypothetical protein
MIKKQAFIDILDIGHFKEIENFIEYQYYKCSTQGVDDKEKDELTTTPYVVILN